MKHRPVDSDSVNIQITLKMSLKICVCVCVCVWTTRFIIATGAMLDLLQSPVTKYLFPCLFLFFKLWWGYCERLHLSVHPYVCPDILLSMRECPTVRPSCYLFLNHWVEFYQTCYIISPHSMGVQEKHYFSICSPVRASVICPFAHHTISFKTTGWNSTKLTASLPLTVRVCESSIIIPFVRQSVRSSVRHATHPKQLGGI